MRQRFWQSIVGRHAWAAFGPLVLIALCAQLAAQESPRGPRAPAPALPPVNALPGEVMPPVYQLRDKDGALIPVPGFDYDEFKEAWAIKQQLDRQQQPPKYTLTEFSVDGSVKRNAVELNARLTVVTHVAEWIRIPLRLRGAVLRELAEYRGPSEHRFEPDPPEGGQVLWIRGQPAASHTVHMQLAAPFTQRSNESQFRLAFPSAAVSRLQLRLPLADAVAKVTSGGVLDTTRSLPPAATEVLVRGLGGELDLAWRTADALLAAHPAVLDVSEGQQTIRINGRSIAAHARFKVQSFGGEFDRFQVRLPPGATFAGGRPPEIAWVEVDSANSDERGKVYEARLEKPTLGPVEVELFTDRPYDARSDEALPLAGFEVIGAVRQWGEVDVAVDGNWRVTWAETQGVRQVDDLNRDDLVAQFEYSAQPFALAARIVPQESRVRVEGEYQVLVGTDEARLHGKLRYTIRGARLRGVFIELAGWDIDAISPANDVETDDAASNPNEPLFVSFVQPTVGNLELTFAAHRKLPASGELAFELPRPIGDVIAPATVAVIPDDNVVLEFQGNRSTGLAQLAKPNLPGIPARQQEPLFYRTESVPARFVAKMQVHSQTVSADLSTQITVDESESQVVEQLALQIDYQPLDHLTLAVPQGLRLDRLNVQLGGEKLSVQPVRDHDEHEQGYALVRVALPTPQIGRVVLSISYPAPHERLVSAAPVQVAVPLVIPSDGLLTNDLVVTPASGIVIVQAEEPWLDNDDIRPPLAPGSLALTGSRSTSDVVLTLQSNKGRSAPSTTVTHAWVHTRLINTRRDDRAVFRLRSGNSSVRLTLPQGADLKSLVVEVDNRLVKHEVDVQAELSVPLAASPRGEHLLELRYYFADRQPLGALSLVGPQIKSAGLIQPMYWQLTLPETEHLLWAPDSFTREFSWSWAAWLWRRQPALSERDLEAWIGAAPAMDLVPIEGELPEQLAWRQQQRARSRHPYLFSTAAVGEPLNVKTISRARLVLLASLPVLAVALLMIYAPVLRHPLLLLGLALLVALGALVDSDVALLLAQSALLGTTLAIIALLLARKSAAPGKVAPPVPMHGSSRAIERPRSGVFPRPTSAASQSAISKPLLPAAVREGEP